jgi:hypothetical protein
VRVTKRQLRKIVREAILREQSKGMDGGGEEVPENIQKKVDKNEKMGIPSAAVYDDTTGKWRVEELN